MSDFDFDSVFALWLRTKRFTADPRTLAQIGLYVRGMLDEEGGFISLAHFERAYLQLVDEGVIEPFREAAPEVEDGSVPADVVRFIKTAPVEEVRRRYNSDVRFRRQFDQYSSGSVEQTASELTAEAYHKLPATEVIRRYRSEPAFKEAVDGLVQQGLI